MNKRQAKKKFKKKYGMNPEQVCKIISGFDWGEIANKLTEAISKLPEMIEKYIEDNPDVIEKLKGESNAE